MNLLILFLSILSYYIKYGVIFDLYWTMCAEKDQLAWIPVSSFQKDFDFMIENTIK